MTVPTCHPDRKHRARGLCGFCYHKQWVEANRDRDRAAKLRWHKANPEYARENSKRQYYKHIEKKRAYARERQAVRRALGLIDIEAARRSKAAWKKRNPENNQIHLAKRRAALNNIAINDFTLAQWRELKAEYNHCCFYCKLSSKRLTQDHMIPISRGGAHTKANIVPARMTCNCKKNARTTEEYLNALHAAS